MLHKILEGKKLILGSASPRRKELLSGLGVEFTIDTGNSFEEYVPLNTGHELIPQLMAVGKSNGFHRKLQDDEILITADTMVLCSDEIMGKPKDREDAVRMIEKLQDNTHTVYTGVCIRSLEKEVSFTVATDVRFGNLTPDEIKRSGFDTYFVDHTTGIYPIAASGMPFTATYLQSKGDVITDLHEDLAAEQKARTTYDNLLRLIDDPDVRDPIKFLREREIVHYQRFGEGLQLMTDKLDSKNFYAFNPNFDKHCMKNNNRRKR